MKCSYHETRDAISKCKVCGADLCNVCDEFQRRKGFCSRCSAYFDVKNYETFKRGLKYNIISLVCAILFVAFWIVCIFVSNLDSVYLICGGIISALILAISIFLLTNSAVNIKKIKHNAKESFEKYIKIH